MGHVGLHETTDSNEMKIFRIFDFTETKRNLRFTKNLHSRNLPLFNIALHM